MNKTLHVLMYGLAFVILGAALFFRFVEEVGPGYYQPVMAKNGDTILKFDNMFTNSAILHKPAGYSGFRMYDMDDAAVSLKVVGTLTGTCVQLEIKSSDVMLTSQCMPMVMEQ